MYRQMFRFEKHFGTVRAIALTILLSWAIVSLPAANAEEASRLDELFEQLREADAAAGLVIEHEIMKEWSRSGSPSMDLLLARGRSAMSRERHMLAIRRLSALVEFAPGFAEGWNARATAYYLAGMDDLSLADIGRTLMLEPRHFGALSGYGMIMEKRGNVVAALKAYELVEELYPNREGLADTLERLRKKTADLSI